MGGSNIIDGQLNWILSLVREYEVPCWLNSGTLLGLKREGRLLDHDQDIDLSLWADDEVKLKKLLPHFKKAGYQRLAVDYNGMRFQYNLSPGEGAETRNIDINLFRRCGEYAWCPEYYFKIQPGSAGGGQRSGSGALRRALRFLWRSFIALIPLKVSISSWPWRYFVNQATWWIPATYYDNLTFDEEFGAFIPTEWESYLEFRYGDWTVPCRDWLFHRDDGGLITSPPDLILSSAPSRHPKNALPPSSS